MQKRIINTTADKEDELIEPSIRPLNLKEYIRQKCGFAGIGIPGNGKYTGRSQRFLLEIYFKSFLYGSEIFSSYRQYLHNPVSFTTFINKSRISRGMSSPP